MATIFDGPNYESIKEERWNLLVNRGYAMWNKHFASQINPFEGLHKKNDPVVIEDINAVKKAIEIFFTTCEYCSWTDLGILDPFGDCEFLNDIDQFEPYSAANASHFICLDRALRCLEMQCGKPQSPKSNINITHPINNLRYPFLKQYKYKDFILNYYEEDDNEFWLPDQLKQYLIDTNELNGDGIFYPITSDYTTLDDPSSSSSLVSSSSLTILLPDVEECYALSVNVSGISTTERIGYLYGGLFNGNYNILSVDGNYVKYNDKCVYESVYKSGGKAYATIIFRNNRWEIVNKSFIETEMLKRTTVGYYNYTGSDITSDDEWLSIGGSQLVVISTNSSTTCVESSESSSSVSSSSETPSSSISSESSSSVSSSSETPSSSISSESSSSVSSSSSEEITPYFLNPMIFYDTVNNVWKFKPENTTKTYNFISFRDKISAYDGMIFGDNFQQFEILQYNSVINTGTIRTMIPATNVQYPTITTDVTDQWGVATSTQSFAKKYKYTNAYANIRIPSSITFDPPFDYLQGENCNITLINPMGTLTEGFAQKYLFKKELIYTATNAGKSHGLFEEGWIPQNGWHKGDPEIYFNTSTATWYLFDGKNNHEFTSIPVWDDACFGLNFDSILVVPANYGKYFTCYYAAQEEQVVSNYNNEGELILENETSKIISPWICYNSGVHYNNTEWYFETQFVENEYYLGYDEYINAVKLTDFVDGSTGNNGLYFQEQMLLPIATPSESSISSVSSDSSIVSSDSSVSSLPSIDHESSPSSPEQDAGFNCVNNNCVSAEIGTTGEYKTIKACEDECHDSKREFKDLDNLEVRDRQIVDYLKDWIKPKFYDYATFGTIIVKKFNQYHGGRTEKLHRELILTSGKKQDVCDEYNRLKKYIQTNGGSFNLKVRYNEIKTGRFYTLMGSIQYVGGQIDSYQGIGYKYQFNINEQIPVTVKCPYYPEGPLSATQETICKNWNTAVETSKVVSSVTCHGVDTQSFRQVPYTIFDAFETDWTYISCSYNDECVSSNLDVFPAGFKIRGKSVNCEYVGDPSITNPELQLSHVLSYDIKYKNNGMKAFGDCTNYAFSMKNYIGISFGTAKDVENCDCGQDVNQYNVATNTTGTLGIILDTDIVNAGDQCQELSRQDFAEFYGDYSWVTETEPGYEYRCEACIGAGCGFYGPTEEVQRQACESSNLIPYEHVYIPDSYLTWKQYDDESLNDFKKRISEDTTFTEKYIYLSQQQQRVFDGLSDKIVEKYIAIASNLETSAEVALQLKYSFYTDEAYAQGLKDYWTSVVEKYYIDRPNDIYSLTETQLGFFTNFLKTHLKNNEKMQMGAGVISNGGDYYRINDPISVYVVEWYGGTINVEMLPECCDVVLNDVISEPVFDKYEKKFFCIDDGQ